MSAKPIMAEPERRAETIYSANGRIMRTIEKSELLLASLDKQFFFAKGQKRDIVSSLCGLQAQFANNPGHALRIRAADYSNHGWHGGLVKTWTFRGTLHAVLRDELNLFLSAMGIPESWNERWGLGKKDMAKWAAHLHGWIREGIVEREELKEKCRKKGITRDVLDIVFHGWGGLIREMCHRGLIAYQSGTAKRFVACDDFEPGDCESARAEILRRYFRHLGPATLDDCAAFTGFKKSEIAALLKRRPLPLESVVCDGVEYWYMGEWDASGDIPPCLFLSGFDQLLLAYKDRSRLLDDKHKPDVVTNTGIIHPLILLNGRAKAKWEKDGGTILVTPFAGISQRNKKRIASFAKKLFDEDMKEVTFAE